MAQMMARLPLTARWPRAAILGVLLAACCAGCAQDPQARAQKYLESGERFARAGRDAAAVIEYRNAARLAPTSEAAHRRLGEALARLGRADESRLAFQQADRLVGDGPLPQGEAALRDVIARRPRHVGARLALAEILMDGHAVEEARAQLRAALDVDPGRELAHRGLAALALEEGRWAEAEQHLRAAAAALPQQHRSQIALADYLFGQRRFDEASAVLDTAAANPALAAAAAVRRIALADETGSPVEARRDLTALLETDPTAEAWALQGQFAYRDGDLAEAEEAARRALALDPALAFAQALVDTVRWEQLQAGPAPPVSTARARAAR